MLEPEEIQTATAHATRRAAQPVAFITGAASGIGRALARRLAAQGTTVIIADRDGIAAESVAAELVAAGRSATACTLDVTDREGVRAAIDSVVEHHGRLDYLFNNAGIGIGGEARDFGPDEWDRVIAVNLNGVIHGILAAYPIMLRQGFGHIINTASVAGLIPLPGEISYTASKWAVAGLTHTLRAEAADLGVKVTLVCPGKVETPIYATSPVIGFDREKVLALWPRGVTPDECARVILRGVARNRAVVVITRTARLLWWIERLSPELMIALGRRYMQQMRSFRLDRSSGS